MIYARDATNRAISRRGSSLVLVLIDAHGSPLQSNKRPGKLAELSNICFNIYFTDDIVT